MKADIIARRLQELFPKIQGIKAITADNGGQYIHLGDAAEGGMIIDAVSQKMAADPEYRGLGFDKGTPAADYYGEFRGGYPWIHPDLEKAVKNYGYFIEWYDPGTLRAYPI